jgi:predicted TIM-barrel fold metal-dependent hydrolase
MINMKKVLLLLIIIPFSTCLYCQLEVHSLQVHDYHVHVFSEDLSKKMQEELGSFESNGFEVIYQDLASYGRIERILVDNNAAKMLLISAGYVYSRLIIDEEKCEAAVRRENDFLARIVRGAPDRFIGFYGIDPLKSFAIREINRCHFELGLHGIKLHLQGNGIDLTDSVHLSKLRQVFELASQEGIPLLIHNNSSNIGSGENYVRRFIESVLSDFEGLTIIFAHAGGGGLFFNFQYDFLIGIKDFMDNSSHSGRHNIYFELSGTAAIREYPGERSMEELSELMSEIGEDRFLFGSDFPYRTCSTYLRVLEHELRLDSDVLRAIVERNIFEELK